MVPHLGVFLMGLRRTGVARVCLVATLLSFATVGDSSAQHVRGLLRDVETRVMIPLGILSLLAADSTTIIVRTVSDVDGFWRLDAPGPGVYFVAAERIGYRAMVAGPITIEADDELTSVFDLERSAIRLEPIEVTARSIRQQLEVNGFFERQKGNFGHFVTPEDIDERQATRVSDLLTGIPGVQRVMLSGGSVGPAQIQLRGSSLSQGGLCRPRIFVDGLIYSRGDGRPVRVNEGNATERNIEDEMRQLDQALSLDDIGHPSTIAAIEVYRSASQVPVQFGGSSVETLCGVIVVWTRTGRLRAGAR